MASVRLFLLLDLMGALACAPNGGRTAAADGAPGPTGAEGSDGEQGASGPEGTTGPQGTSGPTGTTGPSGPAGESGPLGAAGSDGIAGVDGSAGASGPTGADGSDGDAGHNALLRLTDLVSSAECLGSATQIEAGNDDGAGGGTADNGILETGEVDDIETLCEAAADTSADTCLDAEKRLLFDRLWSTLRPTWQAEAATALANNPRSASDVDAGTYRVQSRVKDVLRMAHVCDDRELLDEVLAVLDVPRAYLRPEDQFLVRSPWPGTYASLVTFDRNYTIWGYQSTDNNVTYDAESWLYSSQFVHPVSYALRIISSIHPDTRSAAMTAFAENYFPIVWNEHVKRWCFADDGNASEQYNTRGLFGARWATCNEGSFNHREHLRNVRDRSYGTGGPYLPQWNDDAHCNWLTDTDTWILASAAEILLANELDPNMAPLSASEIAQLREYVTVGVEAIQSWLTTTPLADFDQAAREGIVFGVGAANDLDAASFDAGSLLYTSYTGYDFPDANDSGLQPNLGWDLSHGSRFVEVLESLAASRVATGLDFPTWSDRQGFANQLAYGVFSKDLEVPTFANFMSGHNGWYRVNYTTIGTGSFPSSLSAAYLYGGYPFWAKYNSDLQRTTERLWAMIRRSTMLWDDAGNGHAFSVTSYSMPQKVIQLPGKKGLAMQRLAGFGSDPLNSDLTLGSQAQATVMGWVYLDPADSKITANAHLLFGFANEGFWVLQDGRIAYWKSSGGFQVTDVNASSAVGWHHLTMTRETNGTKSVFVDGVAEDSFADGDHNSSHLFRIQGLVAGDARGVTFDEIKVFDRVLTGAEIQTEMNDTALAAEMLAYWSFDEAFRRDEYETLKGYYGAMHDGGASGGRTSHADLSLASSASLLSFIAAQAQSVALAE